MTPEARVRRVTIAILILGFAAAAAIYVAARPRPGNPLGYEPEDTKQYLREMEVYGGKANLIAEDIREGFASLWHGKRLAYTVALITLVAAGGFWFAARPLPPLEEEDEPPSGSLR
jgi:hypothetical protein